MIKGAVANAIAPLCTSIWLSDISALLHLWILRTFFLPVSGCGTG